jgi:hypothetical protein
MLLTELAAMQLKVLKEANRRSETNWRALEPYDSIPLPQPSSTYKYQDCTPRDHHEQDQARLVGVSGALCNPQMAVRRL